jgi:UDP-glucose 4-epimerase
MTKILVTGAAGFIGSHTVDFLLASGHEVVGVDNLRTGSRENLRQATASPRFDFQVMDITEVETFTGLVRSQRPDVVIHLAGLVSVQDSRADPALNVRLNVGGTQAVIDAVISASVPRVVFASSAAVYGDSDSFPLREDAPKQPLNPYGEAKLASEALLARAAMMHGFTAVSLRYFNVYGSRQALDSPYSGVVSRFLACCRRNEAPVIFGDGRQTRDFIHVSDIARANAQAALLPGLPSGDYNVASGQETSLLDLIALLRAMQPSLPMPKFSAAQPGDIRRSVGDPARWCAVSGFSPQETLRVGLLELVDCPSIENLVSDQLVASCMTKPKV